MSTLGGARRRQWSVVSPRLCVVAAALWMISLLATGCASSDDTDSSPAAPPLADPVGSEVERGPVKFTVEISPAKPRLSDQPQLTLTLRAQKGVRVEKPPFGEALGDFLIRDFYEPPADFDGQVEIIKQVYTLEPTRAGTLTVAPILVRFYDERNDEESTAHTLESEALTVEVTTVLADQAPTLADLRPLAGPLELPVTGGFSWSWAVAIFCGLVMLGFLLRHKRRARSISEPAKSPQELAWLELEQIVTGKLAESDVKEFYVELTGVVRRYIERSTGVRAPEQTTEEFLREIVSDDLFADDDRQRLRDFLESADLVKFAAVHPAAKDMEASFERAQEFIQLKRSDHQEVAA